MCGKQGGKLNGNACRKLLNCVDSLELELRKYSAQAYITGLPFVKALRCFNSLVHSSFGSVLLDGWKKAISEFTLSYTDLVTYSGQPITITPKVNKLYSSRIVYIFIFNNCARPTLS